MRTIYSENSRRLLELRLQVKLKHATASLQDSVYSRVGVRAEQGDRDGLRHVCLCSLQIPAPVSYSEHLR